MTDHEVDVLLSGIEILASMVCVKNNIKGIENYMAVRDQITAQLIGWA